jgi:hypothetical protein
MQLIDEALHKSSANDGELIFFRGCLDGCLQMITGSVEVAQLALQT